MTTKEKIFTTNFLLTQMQYMCSTKTVLKIPSIVYESSDGNCAIILGHKTNFTASLPVSYTSASEQSTLRNWDKMESLHTRARAPARARTHTRN